MKCTEAAPGGPIRRPERITVRQPLMKRVRRLSAAGLAFALVPGAMALVTAAPAMAAVTGKIYASPCLYLHTSASTASARLACVPYRATVVINCTAVGTAVDGRWGTTKLWDHTEYAGHSGYVSDGWVYTGTNDAVAGTCRASRPTSSASGPHRAKGRTIGYNMGDRGQCTWGALAEWHKATGYYPFITPGDAKTWATGARNAGWSVVSDPQPRSIVVFQPGVYYADKAAGHVAWVESVQHRSSGTYVKVIEMNFTYGPYRWDTRTIKNVAGMSYILAP